jgi:hypothetical protein
MAKAPIANAPIAVAPSATAPIDAAERARGSFFGGRADVDMCSV